ncbi:hypothetical protein FOJ82_11150 [Tessaracoccus rhinocerotis]|uniref:Uncharacterized protein n=1 Tax=Tessaracoccus rhinocerotis TaxID=1689449 RepID=A0A553JZG9_9ACTN|nr:hypothetical protein [Tessaracoccus rhinocerotis]TRY17817.1 hypothetical protein FOJ82_11150 [Tessaracoccus rhinocerotis]
MTDDSMRAAVDYFSDSFLAPDDGWIDVHEDRFSYWPGRVAQHFLVTEAEPGVYQWQMYMPLVSQVRDPNLASWLCLRLNRFAAGWSFAFDRDSATLTALAAVSAPITFDRFLLRFATAVTHAGWFCELILDDLAEAVGGVAILSSPSWQAEPRKVPDASMYLPTAYRERPEWIRDLVAEDFPPMEETGTYFYSRMRQVGLPIARAVATPFLIDSGNEVSIEIPPGEGLNNAAALKASFDNHPLLGTAWRVDVAAPWVPQTGWAEMASLSTLMLFEGQATNLTGAWTVVDGQLSFRTWVTSHELRRNEALASFDGQGAHVLWGPASPSLEALQALEESAPAARGRVQRPSEEQLAELEQSVLAGVHAGGRLLEEVWPPATDGADRRHLWWPEVDVMLVLGWFNPMGPTVHSVERRRNPSTGKTHILTIMRHPMHPRIVDHGEWSQSSQVLQAVADELCQGSLPTFVELRATGEDGERLMGRVGDGWTRLLQEQASESFAAAAHQIWACLGEPWAYAGDPLRGDYLAERDRRGEPGDRATFEEWWALASDPLNVWANYRQLRRAWDGSLNFQATHGNTSRGLFDIGPFLLTYDTDGSLHPSLHVTHYDSGAAPSASFTWRSPELVTVRDASGVRNAWGDVLTVALETPELFRIGDGVLDLNVQGLPLPAVLRHLKFSSRESKQDDWDDWEDRDGWIGSDLDSLLEDGYRVGRWRVSAGPQPVRVITNGRTSVAVAWRWDEEILEPIWEEQLFLWRYSNDAPIGFEGAGSVGWIAPGVVLEHVAGDWNPGIRVQADVDDPVPEIGAKILDGNWAVPVLRSTVGLHGVASEKMETLYGLGREGGHARLLGEPEFSTAVIDWLVAREPRLTRVIQALTDPSSMRGREAREVLEAMERDPRVTWYDVDDALRGPLS